MQGNKTFKYKSYSNAVTIYVWHYINKTISLFFPCVLHTKDKMFGLIATISFLIKEISKYRLVNKI